MIMMIMHNDDKDGLIIAIIVRIAIIATIIT